MDDPRSYPPDVGYASAADPRIHRPTTLSLRGSGGAHDYYYYGYRPNNEVASADRIPDPGFPRRRKAPEYGGGGANNRGGSPWYAAASGSGGGGGGVGAEHDRDATSGGCPAPAVSWDAGILQSQPNVSSSTDSLDYPPGAVPGVYDERARSLVRTGSRMSVAGRRSRSEGPSMGRGRGIFSVSYLSRPPPFGCDVDVKLANQSHPPPAPSAYVPKESEYRLQFAWPTRSVESTPRRYARGMGYAAAAMHPALAMQSRKSQSLSLLQQQEGGWLRAGDVDRHDDRDGIDGADTPNTGRESVADGADGDPRRKKYKSEYKKKFRPFSAYQYIDGQWRKVKGPGDGAAMGQSPQQQVFQVENYSVTNTPMDHGVAAAHAAAAAAPGAPGSSVSSADASAKPWYAEVTELRKQASGYKCRGWGTGLTPDHLADIYSKQAAFLEHSGPRSLAMSLGALVSPSVGKSDRDSKEPSSSKEREPKATKTTAAATSAAKPAKPAKSAAVTAAARASSARAKSVPDTAAAAPTPRAASAATTRPRTAPKPAAAATAKAASEGPPGKPKVAEKPSAARLQQARVKREAASAEKKTPSAVETRAASARAAAENGANKEAGAAAARKKPAPATGGWTAHLPESKAAPQKPAKKPTAAAAPAAPAAAAKRPATAPATSAATPAPAVARKPKPKAAPAPSAAKAAPAAAASKQEAEPKPKPIKPRKAAAAQPPAPAPAAPKEEVVEPPVAKKQRAPEDEAGPPAAPAPPAGLEAEEPAPAEVVEEVPAAAEQAPAPPAAEQATQEPAKGEDKEEEEEPKSVDAEAVLDEIAAHIVADEAGAPEEDSAAGPAEETAGEAEASSEDKEEEAAEDKAASADVQQAAEESETPKAEPVADEGVAAVDEQASADADNEEEVEKESIAGEAPDLQQELEAEEAKDPSLVVGDDVSEAGAEDASEPPKPSPTHMTLDLKQEEPAKPPTPEPERPAGPYMVLEDPIFSSFIEPQKSAAKSVPAQPLSVEELFGPMPSKPAVVEPSPEVSVPEPVPEEPASGDHEEVATESKESEVVEECLAEESAPKEPEESASGDQEEVAAQSQESEVVEECLAEESVRKEPGESASGDQEEIGAQSQESEVVEEFLAEESVPKEPEESALGDHEELAVEVQETEAVGEGLAEESVQKDEDTPLEVAAEDGGEESAAAEPEVTEDVSTLEKKEQEIESALKDEKAETQGQPAQDQADSAEVAQEEEIVAHEDSVNETEKETADIQGKPEDEMPLESSQPEDQAEVSNQQEAKDAELAAEETLTEDVAPSNEREPSPLPEETSSKEADKNEPESSVAAEPEVEEKLSEEPGKITEEEPTKEETEDPAETDQTPDVSKEGEASQNEVETPKQESSEESVLHEIEALVEAEPATKEPSKPSDVEEPVASSDHAEVSESVGDPLEPFPSEVEVTEPIESRSSGEEKAFSLESDAKPGESVSVKGEELPATEPAIEEPTLEKAGADLLLESAPSEKPMPVTALELEQTEEVHDVTSGEADAVEDQVQQDSAQESKSEKPEEGQSLQEPGHETMEAPSYDHKDIPSLVTETSEADAPSKEEEMEADVQDEKSAGTEFSNLLSTPGGMKRVNDSEESLAPSELHLDPGTDLSAECSLAEEGHSSLGAEIEQRISESESVPDSQAKSVDDRDGEPDPLDDAVALLEDDVTPTTPTVPSKLLDATVASDQGAVTPSTSESVEVDNTTQKADEKVSDKKVETHQTNLESSATSEDISKIEKESEDPTEDSKVSEETSAALETSAEDPKTPPESDPVDSKESEEKITEVKEATTAESESKQLLEKFSEDVVKKEKLSDSQPEETSEVLVEESPATQHSKDSTSADVHTDDAEESSEPGDKKEASDDEDSKETESLGKQNLAELPAGLKEEAYTPVDENVHPASAQDHADGKQDKIDASPAFEEVDSRQEEAASHELETTLQEQEPVLDEQAVSVAEAQPEAKDGENAEDETKVQEDSEEKVDSKEMISASESSSVPGKSEESIAQALDKEKGTDTSEASKEAESQEVEHTQEKASALVEEETFEQVKHSLQTTDKTLEADSHQADVGNEAETSQLPQEAPSIDSIKEDKTEGEAKVGEKDASQPPSDAKIQDETPASGSEAKLDPEDSQITPSIDVSIAEDDSKETTQEPATESKDTIEETSHPETGTEMEPSHIESSAESESESTSQQQETEIGIPSIHEQNFDEQPGSQGFAPEYESIEKMQDEKEVKSPQPVVSEDIIEAAKLSDLSVEPSATTEEEKSEEQIPEPEVVQESEELSSVQHDKHEEKTHSEEEGKEAGPDLSCEADSKEEDTPGVDLKEPENLSAMAITQVEEEIKLAKAPEESQLPLEKRDASPSFLQHGETISSGTTSSDHNLHLGLDESGSVDIDGSQVSMVEKVAAEPLQDTLQNISHEAKASAEEILVKEPQRESQQPENIVHGTEANDDPGNKEELASSVEGSSHAEHDIEADSGQSESITVGKGVIEPPQESEKYSLETEETPNDSESNASATSKTALSATEEVHSEHHQMNENKSKEDAADSEHEELDAKNVKEVQLKSPAEESKPEGANIEKPVELHVASCPAEPIIGFSADSVRFIAEPEEKSLDTHPGSPSPAGMSINGISDSHAPDTSDQGPSATTTHEAVETGFSPGPSSATKSEDHKDSSGIPDEQSFHQEITSVDTETIKSSCGIDSDDSGAVSVTETSSLAGGDAISPVSEKMESLGSVGADCENPRSEEVQTTAEADSAAKEEAPISESAKEEPMSTCSTSSTSSTTLPGQSGPDTHQPALKEDDSDECLSSAASESLKQPGDREAALTTESLTSSKETSYQNGFQHEEPGVDVCSDLTSAMLTDASRDVLKQSQAEDLYPSGPHSILTVVTSSDVALDGQVSPLGASTATISPKPVEEQQATHESSSQASKEKADSNLIDGSMHDSLPAKAPSPTHPEQTVLEGDHATLESSPALSEKGKLAEKETNDERLPKAVNEQSTSSSGEIEQERVNQNGETTKEVENTMGPQSPTKVGDADSSVSPESSQPQSICSRVEENEMAPEQPESTVHSNEGKADEGASDEKTEGLIESKEAAAHESLKQLEETPSNISSSSPQPVESVSVRSDEAHLPSDSKEDIKPLETSSAQEEASPALQHGASDKLPPTEVDEPPTASPGLSQEDSKVTSTEISTSDTVKSESDSLPASAELRLGGEPLAKSIEQKQEAPLEKAEATPSGSAAADVRPSPEVATSAAAIGLVDDAHARFEEHWAKPAE